MGDGPEMFSLCLWREVRTAILQRLAEDTAAEVSPEPRDQGTFLTLKWTPIEFTEAAIAMFIQQMASMTGGWGGSFDKLDDWLAH